MSEKKSKRAAIRAEDLEAYAKIGEVVIELGDARNRNFMWPPTRQTLRGTWKKANLVGMTIATVMTEMPDLPGMYVVIDGRARTSKIVDPLGSPAAKDLLLKAKAVNKAAFRTEAGTAPDHEQRDMSLTDMKTVLYWMRRFVDAESPQARIVAGRLPEMDDIEDLPGQTRAELWNSSALARRFREEPDSDVAKRNNMTPR